MPSWVTLEASGESVAGRLQHQKGMYKEIQSEQGNHRPIRLGLVDLM
jgi:hypothetical protein